jgi:hypothetical protein
VVADNFFVHVSDQAAGHDNVLNALGEHVRLFAPWCLGAFEQTLLHGADQRARGQQNHVIVDGAHVLVHVALLARHPAQYLGEIGPRVAVWNVDSFGQVVEDRQVKLATILVGLRPPGVVSVAQAN